MTETTDLYAISERAKQFGLLGGFPGDDKLVEEIQWCQSVYTPEGAGAVPNQEDLDRLVQLLNMLPSRARKAVVSQVLSQSPFRDTLLQSLFDHCVHQQDEGEGKAGEKEGDDFVLVLTDSTLLLDTEKYLVLEAVLMLLSVCNVEVAVNVSRRYLRSASTRHQGAFLAWCAKQSPSAFSDDELWEFYRDSPALVQKEVRTACRATGGPMPADGAELKRGHPAHPREAFLQKIVQNTQHDPELVFWCSSAAVESALLRVDGESSRRQDLGMRRWSFHAQVYLEFIQKTLSSETSPLKRGQIWGQLEESLPPTSMGDLKSHHIHALVQLLSESNVLKTKSGLPQNVQNFIESLAAEGKDISSYEGVETVLLDDAFLSVIPRKERAKLAVKAIERNDFATFSKYQNYVGHNDLPFSKYFHNASIEDLWNHLSGRLARKTSKTDSDRFFGHFACTDFTQNNRRGFTIEALWDWQAWHLRASPERLTDQQRQTYAQSAGVGPSQDDDTNSKDWQNKLSLSLWRIWFNSFKIRFVDNGLVELTTSRVRNSKERHRPQERSRITLEAKYAHELVNLAIQGIQALPAELIPIDELTNFLQRILALYKVLPYNHLVVVKNLNEALGRAVSNEYIPRLGNMLHFDPKSTSPKYVSSSTIANFEQRAQWLTDRIMKGKDHTELRDLLDVLASVLSAASAGGHNVPLPNAVSRFEQVEEPQRKKIKFVYYDSELHQRTIDTVVGLIAKMMKATKTYPDLDKEHALAWDLLSRHELATLRSKDNLHDFNRYLSRCIECLPPVLFESEKQKILNLALSCSKSSKQKDAKNFMKDFDRVAFSLLRLGLLKEVIDADDFVLSQEEKNGVLLRTQDFQFDVVQTSLKEHTSGIDGEKRAEGHLAWLKAALSTQKRSDCLRLSHFADALTYTVGRIRNEAGLYRRKIFDVLAFDLLQEVVTECLGHPSHPRALAAAKQITSKLEEMLKNDQSRRDSVGRLGYFKNLSGATMRWILDTENAAGVARGPTTKRGTEMPQMWVSFAVKIHWLQTQAEDGERGLMTYRWQADSGWELGSCRSVSAKFFDQIYPRPESIHQLARLREPVDLIRRVSEEDPVMGPCEFVSLLGNALDEVWDKEKFPSGPLSWSTTWCPEDESVRSALLHRLLPLYRVCDVGWEESAVLVDAFDRALSNLDDAPHYHYSFAETLLENVLKIYDAFHTRGVCHFYEIPRLSRAVETVFLYSAQHGMQKQIGKWYKLYCTKLLEQGFRDWDEVRQKDSRLLSFLVKHCRDGCEPPSCRLIPPSDKDRKIAVANRRCVLARELLAISKNTLWMDEVKGVIASERQDLVQGNLHSAKTIGSEVVAGGPFVKSDRSIDQLSYEWLSSSVLSSMAPAVSRWYADHALRLAIDPNASVGVRVQAIENFCGAPSTGNRDVMNALEKEELLDGPIQEAIIVKIFSLDSPWHVISFLLTSSLKEGGSNQQRMTAALLGHIAKHVQLKKVVKMLGMMLDAERRVQLRMTLHKAIIRMLFDNRRNTVGSDDASEETTRLLQAEWDRPDLPVEMTHIMVERCVESVATAHSPSASAWEWGILESLVAKDGNMLQNTDILMCLFAASWRCCPAETVASFFRKEPADEQHGSIADDVKLLQGRELGHLSVSSLETGQRYHRLLGSLEENVANPFWKMLTKAYRLSFTVIDETLGTDEMPDDSRALDEMEEYLCHRSEGKEPFNHIDKCAVEAIACLFEMACGKSLSRDCRIHPEKEFASICQESATATKFRDCYGNLLANVLDAPMRDVFSRERSVTAIAGMSARVHIGRTIWDDLVGRNFKHEIALISDDAEGLLRSFSVPYPYGRF